VEPHPLPPDIAALTQQATVPFGDGVLALRDALLAAETCEELFTPQVGVAGVQEG
jgi:NAD+ synthase (glutamine-hydrolysing)